METIPLIFPMHLSLEQKNELLSICSELSTANVFYDAICEECINLKNNTLLSIVGNISEAVHNNQFKRFKFTSYNLRISMIKLSFILEVSSDLVSQSSAILDRILTSTISRIEQIIIESHELYLES